MKQGGCLLISYFSTGHKIIYYRCPPGNRRSRNQQLTRLPATPSRNQSVLTRLHPMVRHQLVKPYHVTLKTLHNIRLLSVVQKPALTAVRQNKCAISKTILLRVINVSRLSLFNALKLQRNMPKNRRLLVTNTTRSSHRKTRHPAIRFTPRTLTSYHYPLKAHQRPSSGQE